jgi:hypothetical protein
MSTAAEVAVVSLLGLGTTSSAIGGAAIGLYFPLSIRMPRRQAGPGFVQTNPPL